MQLKKVNAVSASEVCADITLDEEALALLTDSMNPSEYLVQLTGAGLLQDAIKFLARALPPREAAWWACLSARHGVDEFTSENEVKLLELAEQWVFKPTDENRHATHEAVDIIESDTPVYWAGMSVFWSGGSIVPADLPEMPAAKNLCGMAVSGAVVLAGVTDDVVQSNRLYQLFLKQGIAVANGENAKAVV